MRRAEDVLASPLRWLLFPGWLIYRPIITLRNVAYDYGWKPTLHLPVPVISVGNLTAGGTGKTPVCAWLTERLVEADYNPYVLMRGYGGDGGPNDEAQTLNVPVICNPNRIVSGNQAITAGADCLVLDDGFQHRRVHRDVNIVLIDALRPWGGGAVIPMGLLREGRSSLRRADAIILTRSDHITEAARTRLVTTLQRFGCVVVRARHEPTDLRTLDGGIQHPLTYLAKKSVILASGLGNPAGFEHTCRSLGYQIIDHHRFPDHHPYSDADVALLQAACRQHQATLVVTGKDAVKLRNRGLTGACVVEVAIRFQDDDAEALWQVIQRALSAANSDA